MRNLFLTVAFVASIVAVWACTAAEKQALERWITMSATNCVKEAIKAGRNDLAEKCLVGAVDKGEEVLAAALSDQTCALPTDAGAD